MEVGSEELEGRGRRHTHVQSQDSLTVAEKKKVVLVRSRRPSELSSADREADNDGQRNIAKKSSRSSRIAFPTTCETTAVAMTTTTNATSSVTKKSNLHINSNLIPVSDSKGNVNPILESAPIIDSTDRVRVSRKRQGQEDDTISRRSHSKKRKVSLVRKGRQSTTDRSHDQRAEPALGTSESEDVLLEAPAVPRSININDLKNEL